MPIIDDVGRKSIRIRCVTLGMYLLLAVLGVTMVYPFLMMLTASVSNSLDYNRFSAVPTFCFSREERFVKGIVSYFPDTLRNGMEQFAFFFPEAAAEWTTWQAVGEDRPGIIRFGKHYLGITQNPEQWAAAQRMAGDYAAFAMTYAIDDSICAFNERQVGPFLLAHYRQRVRAEHPDLAIGEVDRRAVALLEQRWGVPLKNFYEVLPKRELNTPWDQPNYWPPQDARAEDFARFRDEYRQGAFAPAGVKAKWYALLRSPEARQVLALPGTGPLTLAELNAALGTQYRAFSDVPYPVTGEASAQLQALWLRYRQTIIPACETRPYPLKLVWLDFLNAEATREFLGLPKDGTLDIAEYNKTFGTSYATLRETPFPVPASAPAKLRATWERYLQTQYPLRLITVQVTPALTASYQQFVQRRFLGNLTRCNAILGTRYPAWSAIAFSPRMPRENQQQADLWMEFTATLPAGVKHPLSAEAAYQRYLLEKYRTVGEVNRQYGWTLTQIAEAEMPFEMAYLVTFLRNDRALLVNALTQNYAFVGDYLLLRGRAVFNTVILIALTLLAALTVNPLAAYALSRFRMRQLPAVILFMLATMAFPAAVSVIPGYLLMRDLHLLNTYAALILPGVANGMSIFLLKGFFDSLPPELYEAAALDGAPEWQVFLRITLPLSKPILAVIALNSFLAAYNSWEWALVVCQKPGMWTLSVWLYQFNTQWSLQPWAVMASFVMASIPVFVVFTLCQNIILRGIVLPQMK